MKPVQTKQPSSCDKTMGSLTEISETPSTNIL